MKNSNSSRKTETFFGHIFRPIPIFFSGLVVGSIITVYGTLTHVNLFNYLGSNNRNILNFYSELFGLSDDYIQRISQFTGYFEQINITVHPEHLSLYALQNSLCENAIIEGDKIQVSALQEFKEEEPENDFKIVQKKINQVLTDGVGNLDVMNINGELASIEINLLTPEKTCIRKPTEIKALEKMLQNQQWKEADIQTYKIMLKVKNRQTEGYLDRDSIKAFPCSYLATLDQLWTRYSGGLFGLSVQKDIYQKTGNDLTEDQLRKYNPDAYIHFNDLVRWIETGEDGKEQWKPYDQFTFSLNAPRGHLPRLESLEAGMKKESGYQLISPNSLPLTSQEIQARNFLFSRVETCKL